MRPSMPLSIQFFPTPCKNGKRRVRIWVDFRYFAFRSSERVK